MRPIRRIALSLAIALIYLAACANLPKENSLYDRLGSTDGITRIVDNLLYELSNNEQALALFTNTDIGRFREKMIEFISNVSGGPVAYTGDDMKKTHKGMNITPAQFNSVVEDLIIAMEKSNTPLAAQNGLLQLLARYYPDIIGNEFQIIYSAP